MTWAELCSCKDGRVHSCVINSTADLLKEPMLPRRDRPSTPVIITRVLDEDISPLEFSQTTFYLSTYQSLALSAGYSYCYAHQFSQHPDLPLHPLIPLTVNLFPATMKELVSLGIQNFYQIKMGLTNHVWNEASFVATAPSDIIRFSMQSHFTHVTMANGHLRPRT